MTNVIWPIKWIRPRKCAHAHSQEVERGPSGQPVYACLACGKRSYHPGDKP